MKFRSIAALFAATILLAACNWFRAKTKEPVNPLLGKWKIDSLAPGKDSSLAAFFLAKAIHDSSGVVANFTNDTIFSSSVDGVDTTFYSFDLKKNLLKAAGPSNEVFSFARVSDSLVTLTSRDSLVFFLKKE
jgi:hypothetical protein